MKTVRAYIDHHAVEHGDSTFLIAPETGHKITFSGLQAGVSSIGEGLDRIGAARGTRIAFLMDNGEWTAQLFLGVMACNRVIVPLNAVAGTVQLEYVLDHSNAEVVFVSGKYQNRLSELLRSVKREIVVITVDEKSGPQWPECGVDRPLTVDAPRERDPALQLYTSGSTGQPKGAVLCHRAIISGGENVVEGHGLCKSDRALCVLPVYHINGAMVTVVAPLVSGGSVVMPTRFSAGSYWSLVSRHQCTWSSIVPTIIKYLLDRVGNEDFDFGNDPRLACFRFGRSASAPLPAVVLKQWEAIFRVPMIETLGLTETAGTVASNPMPPAPRKPGSVGLPFGNEIIVVDEHGNECLPGQVGEILIRGDNVLDCYYRNPAATKSAFWKDWFKTGDLGRKDEDGYIYITGRLKELIIRGGENIAPREIDDVLYRHESVLEAAAVGIEDENYGQEVVACVVIREGYSCSENELKAFCIAAIGEYKAPKAVYFMDDLPKGPSGKILRLKLPELIASI